jgi:hypothetical protein
MAAPAIPSLAARLRLIVTEWSIDPGLRSLHSLRASFDKAQGFEVVQEESDNTRKVLNPTFDNACSTRFRAASYCHR